MQIIKIVLVDDHSIFSKGLSMLLNEVNDFKVIGEASNGNDFIKGLINWSPDIVLMDIKMPEMSGIEATKEGIKLIPDLKVLALTMFGEHHYCKQMAEVGAMGFIQKNISRQKLEEAIRKVYRGENYFSPEILKSISDKTNPKDKLFIEAYNEKLTEREFEVLKHIIMGLSAHEIAEKMFLSYRTVEGHRANLIAKTGTRNVVDLVIFAIKNNIVEI
jgi:DNA-binding NarL/FixJ family response regulator